MSAPIQSVEKSTPIRCLVIQLARLEDTLQSLMALRAATQLYPNLEIHFLARDSFADAAKRVPWIKSVFTMPTAEFIGPFVQGKKNQSQTISDIARWIAPLVETPWNMIINWSFSEASSYLTALIPARIKLGFTRRQDSSFSSTDGWTQYIQAIVQGGVHQNIHLTDILTTQLLTALQIHLGDPQDNGNSPVTSKTFFTLNPEGKKLESVIKESKRAWVSFQLGNNQASRRWSLKSWAQLAHLIVTRNPQYGVLLLADKTEQEEIKKYLKEFGLPKDKSNSVMFFANYSNFDLWVTAISRSYFLISGDSAAVQLSSMLGTKTIHLTIGNRQTMESGPYGNGHYVVSSYPPYTTQERYEVTPEAVYAVWSYAAEEWIHHRQFGIDTHFSQLGWGDMVSGVQVFRSKIRHTKEGGGVCYEPITLKPIQINDWLSMVVGHVARAWYCGWTPPIGQEIERQSIHPSFIQKLRALKESCEVLSKIFEQGYQTASTINKKSSNLKSNRIMGIQDKEDLRDLGKTLIELEKLIERLVKLHPELSPFSQMSKVLMHNLSGNHLADLGREAASCYKQLNEGMVIFKEWIQFTLKLARPVSLKLQSSSVNQPSPNP